MVTYEHRGGQEERRFDESIVAYGKFRGDLY